MDFGLIHTVWTILLMAVFIGIVVWAWSGKRKQRFEQAARAPLDEEDGEHGAPREEMRHE